ncbi:MAG: class I mannose-6-phosphate isomerase, partial [Simkania sp.]|nr:class I mannose-6-phosphate isomerase [Simkania sp.]
MNTLYPLFFKPVYKDYLWGGRRILTEFNRNEPEGIYAESWEVSDRLDGMSLITNGPLKGKTLHDIVQSHPKALFGEAHHSGRFPLLLKLIDAHDNLSIQVHPDDKRAKTYGGEAKTEAWYVLDATEDAVIYAGFNAHYPQEIVNRNLATRDILSMMHTIPVEKGDMIFIPGGRLHAIGKGCFV